MKKYLFLLGFFFFFFPIGLDAREKEIIYKNGDAYYGEVKGNKPNGKGKMFYVNGNTYEGAWIKGIKEGEGKMTFADGLVYEGSWREDSMNGRGRYTRPDGSYCEGEFSNNTFLGGTAFLKTEGGDYLGAVDEHMRPNGQGQLKMADGSFLDGEFKNGFPEGAGKIVAPDGSIVDGIFRRGTLVNGRLTNTDGSWFEGEFKENKPWKGTAGTATGIGFSGEYEKGLPTHGRISREDGSWFEGEFNSDGEPLNGTVKPANDGDFSGEIRDGIPFNGKGKVKEYYGGVFDGEIKEGTATGSLFYNDNSFSFEGKLVNGEPFGDFTGIVPKQSLFDKYFAPGWTLIMNTGIGKMAGFNDISGLFFFENVENVGRTKKHIELALDGHVVNNILQDTTAIQWRVKYEDNKGASVGFVEIELALDWRNGVIKKGRGHSHGDFPGVAKYDEDLSVTAVSGPDRFTVHFSEAGDLPVESPVVPSPEFFKYFCSTLSDISLSTAIDQTHKREQEAQQARERERQKKHPDDHQLVRCPICDGTGVVAGTGFNAGSIHTCSFCNGTGIITKGEARKISEAQDALLEAVIKGILR